jgi:hypothetical protein
MVNEHHNFRQTPERMDEEGERLTLSEGLWVAALLVAVALVILSFRAEANTPLTYDEVEAACEEYRLPCRAIDENTIELGGVEYVRN